jgi:hypothetical protein
MAIVFFSAMIFYFFSTLIYLDLALFALIYLYWNGSKKGVFGGNRRVGGEILMGHKPKGRTKRSPGTVPRAARSGARARWICATALK